jgi:hypothetical protein
MTTRPHDQPCNELDKLNINGSGISLGHPPGPVDSGASGHQALEAPVLLLPGASRLTFSGRLASVSATARPSSVASSRHCSVVRRAARYRWIAWPVYRQAPRRASLP